MGPIRRGRSGRIGRLLALTSQTQRHRIPSNGVIERRRTQLSNVRRLVLSGLGPASAGTLLQLLQLAVTGDGTQGSLQKLQFLYARRFAQYGVYVIIKIICSYACKPILECIGQGQPGTSSAVVEVEMLKQPNGNDSSSILRLSILTLCPLGPISMLPEYTT